MKCLKCGTDTGKDAVFCNDCLQSMEQYPVKPGTVIQLRRREVIQAQKKPPRPKRHNDATEQVVYLKKLIKVMAVLLVVAVIVLGLFTAMLLMQ